MTVCKHKWTWLPRPVFVLTDEGRRFVAYNVECSRCQRRTWAHGAGP